MIATSSLIILYVLQVWAADDVARSELHVKHAITMVVTGILQSVALAVLYRALKRGAQMPPWALAASILALIVLSAMCANTNIDASAYVGYAKLSTFAEAYHESVPSLTGNGFDVIRANWRPLPPLVYGPLWLALDRLLVSHAPTFAAAMMILRLFNAFCIVGLATAVRRLGVDGATVTIVALNPMLYYYFIVQAHNDILPILLVVIGMVVAVRRPLLGALIAGAAGLLKITFVALSTLAYGGRRSPPLTLAYLALSLSSIAAVSAIFGGSDYLNAMTTMGHILATEREDSLHSFSLGLHAALAFVAGVALVCGIVRGAFVGSATYSFNSISAIVYPWYLGWCIPYALRVPRCAPLFFILLPGIAHTIDPSFSLFPMHTFAVLDAYDVIVIALVASDVWSRSRRQACRNQPSAFELNAK